MVVVMCAESGRGCRNPLAEELPAKAAASVAQARPLLLTPRFRMSRKSLGSIVCIGASRKANLDVVGVAKKGVVPYGRISFAPLSPEGRIGTSALVGVQGAIGHRLGSASRCGHRGVRGVLSR